MMLLQLIGIALAYVFVRLWILSAERAGLFPEKAAAHFDNETDPATDEPLGIEPVKSKFIRLEIEGAEPGEYDSIFTVGGFATYRGQLGQVVFLTNRTAKIEIFAGSGNSKESQILDVPIIELSPAFRV